MKKRTRLLSLLLAFLTLLPAGVMLPATAAEVTYGGTDFEGATENAALAKSDGFASVPTYSTVKKEKDNQYLHIPFRGKCTASTGSTGTGNVDSSAMINHAALDPANGSYIIEIDYRPHWTDVTDTRGYTASKTADPTVQCQLRRIVVGGETYQFICLFRMNLKTGTLMDVGTLTGADGVIRDEWNTVKLVVDPVAGTYDTYVNGVLYAEDGYFAGDTKGDQGYRNITVNANQLIVAKCNKNIGAYIDSDTYTDISYVDVDNVKIYQAKGISYTLNGEERTASVGASVRLAEAGEQVVYAYVEPSGGTPYYTNASELIVEEGMRITSRTLRIETAQAPELRTDAPMGLRYVTTLRLSDVEALKNDAHIASIRIGTLILPTLSKANAYTLTKERLRTLSVKHMDVAATVGEWYRVDSAADSCSFAGSIVNLRERNYPLELSGIGYLEVTLNDANATTLCVYGADGWETACGSAASLAKAALPDASVNAATKAMLERFAAAYTEDSTAQYRADLEGLNVMVIGASNFYGAEDTTKGDVWINRMGVACNWNLSTLAVGGMTFSYDENRTATNASMYQRLFHTNSFVWGSMSDSNYFKVGNPSGNPEDVDLIVMQGGNNDYGYKVSALRGEPDSKDPTTYLGAWNCILEKLLADYPNASILVLMAYEQDGRDTGRTVDDLTYRQYTTEGLYALYEQNYSDNDRVILLDSGKPEISGAYVNDSTWRSTYAYDKFHLNDEGMKIVESKLLPYVWYTVTRLMEKGAACDHTFTVTEHIPAKPLQAGKQSFYCTQCGEAYEAELPATKSLKVLAIGNSFSEDATQYLWDICRDAGVTNVIVGNMYIGGCTLDKHYENITGDKDAYVYYKNVSGSFVRTNNYRISAALADEDWDVITLQQASGSSGVSTTYGYLDEIASYISVRRPDAKIYWHLTWAYQQNSTHGEFSKYNKDQMTMYNAILSAYQGKVATDPRIDGMIPSGTAVQNLRTSYIGDTVTRDGYHMSQDIGRYLTAMTWYAALTGGSTAEVDWVPQNYTYLSGYLPVIREAVDNAITSPLAVTASIIDEVYVPEEETDETRMASLGLDINDYELLDWKPQIWAFYNSTSGFGITDAQNSTSNLHKNYITSAKLTKEDIPVGSVIIVDGDRYQYRPEGWESESYKATSANRPQPTSQTVTLVDDAWWGSFTIRAFNLSKNAGGAISEGEEVHLRIYVPKA